LHPLYHQVDAARSQAAMDGCVFDAVFRAVGCRQRPLEAVRGIAAQGNALNIEARRFIIGQAALIARRSRTFQAHVRRGFQLLAQDALAFLLAQQFLDGRPGGRDCLCPGFSHGCANRTEHEQEPAQRARHQMPAAVDAGRDAAASRGTPPNFNASLCATLSLPNKSSCTMRP
jgi:hypothetical protein